MKLWAFISTTIYGRPRPSIGWKAKLSYPTKGSNGKSISSKHFEDYHFLPLILLSFFPKFSYPEISFSSTLLSSAPQFFCSNTRKHITLYFFFILSSISISLFLSHFKTRKWYTNQKKKKKKFFLSLSLWNARTLLCQSTELHPLRNAGVHGGQPFPVQLQPSQQVIRNKLQGRLSNLE